MTLVPDPIARINWAMLALVCLIGGFGMVVLYSAAGGSMRPWAQNHGLRFFTFLLFALLLSRVPERAWMRIAYPGYLILLALLIAVELLGAVKGGSQRWLDVGFMRLQPSELMKLMIVLTLARFYDSLPIESLRGWFALWPAALAIGLPAALVTLQPDLGTATMIVAGGLVVVFLAGVPLRLFVTAGAALAALLPIVWGMMHDYQRRRVLIFMDPESDPLGSGYHITQSKIAIGSGGLFGKGFLNGSQSHLDYLPEGHTDFVFATMSEEWGLIGGIAIIVGFVLLARWGMGVARKANTRFGRLTAAGLTMTIFFYVTINLMMVMGLAPVVGIPLPLVSYGGSAMMTVMLCFGILLSIERQTKLRAISYGPDLS